VSLRHVVDEDEGDPLTRDAVYNGRSERERLDEGEGTQVLLTVDLDQAPTLGNQLADRRPQGLGELAGRVRQSDRPPGTERTKGLLRDRLTPPRPVVHDPDQWRVAKLEGTGDHPVAARTEDPQCPNAPVGVVPGVGWTVLLGEGRAERVRNDPDAAVT